ncbi:MAG: energy-coupling factor transporter ATPase [Firmicutes bacterium]|nr:energy-coupling factor transporter ATPase [Bacillota bacterium]
MQLKVENLTHIYSEGLPFESRALEDVSFTLEQGEFAAIIGHTGSGKSTLIQHINGLLKPSSGRVLLDGIDAAEKSEASRAMRRRIGLVFQYPEYQLFEETILRDVMFGPKNLGAGPDEAEKRAREALALVGIEGEDYMERSPFDLSGGQKRRVAIAGVLAMDPELLILDEPTAGLDPRGHRDILDAVRRIRERMGLSIIMVSHNMDDVADLATRVLVLEKGRLLMDGTPREVFARGDELRAVGLSVPQAKSFMERLAAAEELKELGIDSSAITVSEAEDEIVRAFKRWL